jgi:hypothetical protein
MVGALVRKLGPDRADVFLSRFVAAIAAGATGAL